MSDQLVDGKSFSVSVCKESFIVVLIFNSVLGFWIIYREFNVCAHSTIRCIFEVRYMAILK